VAETLDTDQRRAIRAALARHAYATDCVRLIDGDLTGYDWLVATHRGLYAVADHGVKLVCHGWFFGIRLHDQSLYLFENCANRDRAASLGRLVRFDLIGTRFVDPTILAKGLHTNCHQLAVIDQIIHVLDTANQTVLRYALDGTLLDPVQPFASASSDDTSGAYHHINAIAEVAGRIGVLLHNGKALPEQNSEIAWFDHDWKEIVRTELPGRMCHDISTDQAGLAWHCASLAGDIVSAAGDRLHVIDDYFTRGLAFANDRVCVGYSTFGARKVRDGLRGGVVLFEAKFRQIAQHELDGPPADIQPLPRKLSEHS
jgi:hypothetical protein